MEKTEAQRLKEIRESLNLTQTEFAALLGVKSSTADLERGKTRITGKVVAELMRLYQINPLWLYGESKQQYLPLPETLSTLPKVIQVNQEEEEQILMVNQRASAGYPQNIHDTGWYEQLPAFNFPLPAFRNATYRGFQVEGDSMFPTFYSGDWVLAKAVSSLNEATNHKIYVVVTRDSVVVKKLNKIVSKNFIELISLNKEYAPFTLPVSEIQELWEVTSKLTFSLDENLQNSMLTQLQHSMEELKAQLKEANKLKA